MYLVSVLFSRVAEIPCGCSDAQPTLGEIRLLPIVCVLNLRGKGKKKLREERDVGAER